MKWLLLAIGGVLGTLGRYYFSTGIQYLFGSPFPYGTLTVNLTGAFIAAFLYTLGERRNLLSSNYISFCLVGFCGAFTTFSIFVLETAKLVWTNNPYLALENVASTIIGGMIVFIGGRTLGQLF